MQRSAIVFVLCVFFGTRGAAQSIQLFVDLTDASKNIFHSKMTIPVNPGPLTLAYPKWIPGNHRPSGPISNFVGLRVEAAGKEIPWQRDDIDMYAFHVEVPQGISELQVFSDTITIDGSAGASGPAASSKLLDLNWNQVLVYPARSASDEVTVTASARLPEGWKYATALLRARSDGRDIAFQPVSLTTLVDSPLIAGEYFREILLREPNAGPLRFLDIVGESATAIDVQDKDLASYQKLVDEAAALFGAHHYRQYRFLLTLSDQVGHHGVEHHESSDNSVGERMFSDPNLHLLEASLLPHEYAHSWNGKYRRPAGLVTRNYQEPMKGDLLWIYEGMTDYLGNVLAARSGILTPEQYREALALTAATMEAHRGRTWRTLEDTGRSVQILRLQGSNWSSWRRGLDYYPEGELIWLEVDTIIRQQSKGKRSFDDFCGAFHGGESGVPKVYPYTLDDIVRELNTVTPYDWATLLRERTQSISSNAPYGGIERGGWKLAYTADPNAFVQADEKFGGGMDLRFSLGVTVDDKNEVEDVIPGSAAASAGIAPRMKILAVNERRWSRDALLDSLRHAQTTRQPLRILVENAQFVKVLSLPYFDGPRYPHLVRVTAEPDVLSEIVRRKAP